MVALGVLVFGLFVIYEQFFSTGELAERQMTGVEGRLLAHQRLEELRACDYQALRRAEFPDQYEPVKTAKGFFTRTEIAPTEDAPGLRLRVHVGWAPEDREGRRFLPGRHVTVEGVVYP